MSPPASAATLAAPAARAERDPAARDGDARVGMAIFLGASAMLFAALLFSYGVVRLQSGGEWPPYGAPRLPRTAAALNTLLLLSSGLVLRAGLRRARRQERAADLRPALLAGVGLGIAFLFAQVALWLAMRGQGLLPSSGVYGSVFFALTGFHALHVLGGLIALAALILARRKPPRVDNRLRTTRLVALYWDFVMVVWLVMYIAIFWV